MFMSRLRSLLVELPLEDGEHLEELPFGGELDFVPVGPYLRHNSQERVVFPDANLEVGRMSIGRLRVPNNVRLAFRSGSDDSVK